MEWVSYMNLLVSDWLTDTVNVTRVVQIFCMFKIIIYQFKQKKNNDGGETFLKFVNCIFSEWRQGFVCVCVCVCVCVIRSSSRSGRVMFSVLDY